jgi:hypothetical protein
MPYLYHPQGGSAISLSFVYPTAFASCRVSFARPGPSRVSVRLQDLSRRQPTAPNVSGLYQPIRSRPHRTRTSSLGPANRCGPASSAIRSPRPSCSDCIYDRIFASAESHLCGISSILCSDRYARNYFELDRLGCTRRDIPGLKCERQVGRAAPSALYPLSRSPRRLSAHEPPSSRESLSGNDSHFAESRGTFRIRCLPGEIWPPLAAGISADLYAGGYSTLDIAISVYRHRFPVTWLGNCHMCCFRSDLNPTTSHEGERHDRTRRFP